MDPLDITFPVQGTDVGDGFTQQRPDTTPRGVNVRSFDPSTDRMRGGSRPGIIRYVDQQLPLE